MDFSEIMKQASKIQDQMKSAKEELKNIETEGTSGGGLVKVTICLLYTSPSPRDY